MFAYGMEKAGFEIAAFCEIEEWPRRVLDKHWPDVPKYTDVRELTRERLEEDGVLQDTIRERTGSESGAPGGQGREPLETGTEGIRQAHGTIVPNGAAATDSGNDVSDTNIKIDLVQRGHKRQEKISGVGKSRENNSIRSERDGARIANSGNSGRSIDIITGGFPCQDLSVAGKQAGISGSRSSLFHEIIRLTRELRPRYVVLENVAALLSGESGGWARVVFGAFAEIGFDAEWHVIPAGNPNGLSVGAPHRRERVWIVAYPQREQDNESRRNRVGRAPEAPQQEHRQTDSDCTNGFSADVAYPQSQRQEQRQASERERPAHEQGRDANLRGEPVGHCEAPVEADVAYSQRKGLEGQSRHVEDGNQPGRDDTGEGRPTGGVLNGRNRTGTGPTEPGFCVLAHGIAARLAGSRWLPEPPVGRVATGVPDRVQKLKALGNGLVWPIPYAIGMVIQEREQTTSTLQRLYNT